MPSKRSEPRPKSVDPRPARRQRRFEEILAAAWDVAHDEGLGAVSLDEVARRAGLRQRSLYAYIDSKLAVYGAMFRQAGSTWLGVVQSFDGRWPATARGKMLAGVQAYFDFAVANPERYLLMSVHSVPGFAPSSDAYQPAVQAYGLVRKDLAFLSDKTSRCTWRCVPASSHSSRPTTYGGQRWRRMLPRVISMLADDLGLPRHPHPQNAPNCRIARRIDANP